MCSLPAPKQSNGSPVRIGHYTTGTWKDGDAWPGTDPKHPKLRMAKSNHYRSLEETQLSFEQICRGLG